MMIVEFCKYGNLSNYLRGKRDDFLVYKVSLHLYNIVIFVQGVTVFTTFLNVSYFVKINSLYLNAV